MRLSTSTGDLLRETGSTEKAIEWLSRSSFRHINVELGEDGEIMHDYGADWNAYISRIKAALKNSGVDGVLAHSVSYRLWDGTYEALVECAKRDVRACHELGIPDCVVHPFNKDMPVQELYRLNQRFYRDIIDGTEGCNVYVLTENGGDSEASVSFMTTGADIREFVDSVNRERLGVCWDVSHGNLNRPPKNDQYKNVTALSDKLRALHVSDNFGVGHFHHHNFPLAGVINFDSLICALTDIGYKGVFNFEASYTIRQPQMMPVRRNEWTPPEGRKLEDRLRPTADLKLKAVELLYDIGKFMLDAYGIFEE